MEHAHPGGDMPHTHDDDGLPSDVEPPAPAPMTEAEQVALERGTATGPEPEEPKA